MIEFSIDRWAAWAPGIDGEAMWREWARGKLAIGGDVAPDLSAFPAMLRRRASPAGRLALKSLLGVEAGTLPVVYCSRHGEVARSVELLESIARQEPMSPTEFSMSVHNAVGGLAAIASHSRAHVTAIAAGPDSATQGLIEAVGQLGQDLGHVVLCVFDAPLPAPYAHFADTSEPGFGWAWVLTPPRGTYYTLAWEHGDAEPSNASIAEPVGLQLLRAFLSERVSAAIPGDRRIWRWQRHGELMRSDDG